MSPAEASAIDARTRIGAVSLTVADLPAAREFYERVVGLTVLDEAADVVSLGPAGGEPLVVLHGDASASPLRRRATGLFHLAILLPSRLELAHAALRLVAARWPLDGASDHLVSEALYLSDPEGNGIEIYRDRPREEWRYAGGELQMATLPLDLDGVLDELGPEAGATLEDGAPAPEARVPAGTVMGHVHLQVSELVETEAFYHGLLGLEVTVRSYPGALFLGAGGYHHHLGLNTWNSAGAAPPPAGAAGLRDFEVVLPDATALQATLARVDSGGIDVQAQGETFSLSDPSGSRLRLRAAQ